MAKAAKTVKPVKAKKAPGPASKMVAFTAATMKDAIAATGAKRTGKLLMMPIENIKVVPGFNIRVTDTDAYQNGIVELSKDILKDGFRETQPLSVFPAEIDGEAAVVIINGHRRYAAVELANAQNAGITELPVVFEDPDSSDLDLALVMDKENSGVQPTMYERAILAHRMFKDGMSADEVAETLGKTKRYVADLQALMAAPKDVRELVKHDKLGAYEAIQQLRKDPTGANIMAAHEKAEQKAAEKGKEKAAKLTKSTIEGGEGEKPARNTSKVELFNFQVTEGAEFMYEDAEPFLHLIGDEDWFKGTRSTKKKISLIDLTVEVKIRRPKTPDELAEEDEAKAAKQAAKDATKKKPAKEAPAKSSDDDLLDEDEDEDEDAPDLKALGIVGGDDESRPL